MMQRWTCYAMILVTMLSMAAAAEEASALSGASKQGATWAGEGLEVAQGGVRFRPTRARPVRARPVRTTRARFQQQRFQSIRFRSERFSQIRFRPLRFQPTRFQNSRFQQVQFRRPQMTGSSRAGGGASESRAVRVNAPINTTAAKARANFANGVRALD